MADNYLEKHREEYEKKKEQWMKSKKLHKKTIKSSILRCTKQQKGTLTAQSAEDK